MITLAPGVHTADAFKVGRQYGWQFKGGVDGAGRGDQGTILQLRDRTSTARRLVPTRKGATNPLYVVRAVGSGVVVADVTIDGGRQGHLYNGLRVEKTKGAVVRDIRVVRVPGDSDVPPGETFGINMWRVAGPTVHDVEIDGAGVGASGLGLNSCSGGSTVNFTAHDHPHCKAVALWQHTGGHVFDHVESLHNAFAYGFERCTGTYVIKGGKFRGSTRADIHLASDTGRAQIRVIDPDLQPGQKITVLLSKTEMGKPNRQRASDVQVLVDGKDRTRDLVHFVNHA